MIKKFIYAALFAALVCSCTDDLTPEALRPVIDTDQLGYEHDGKVTFGFNPDFGACGVATKSMTDGSQINNIYVAVFDDTGFKLSEYVKAEPFTTGPLNDTDYQYTIELKVSDNPRILHFLANAPESLRFGSENEIIGSLYTALDGSGSTSSSDAYWQRVRLEKVTARPAEGEDDYDTKMEEYNTVRGSLNSVKLIRNYSKVTATVDEENCTNFSLSGFWFVNAPDRGSFAPYNRNTGTFQTNYAKFDNVDDLEDPEKGNYQGFMLATTTFVTDLNQSDFHEVPAGKSECSGFVYEREKALSSPMYLIIKGTYTDTKGDHTAFYKVAMQDSDGSFYAMLRNFNYLVQIQEVKSAGYASAEAALAGVPSGDISVNIDYVDLPNISDGEARMTVSETTLMIIGASGTETTTSFWYKYEPSIGTIANGTTESTQAPFNPFVEITFDGTSGSTGDVVKSIQIDGSDDDSDCRHVTVHTTAVGSLPKTQTVTITGKRYVSGRYQTITRTIQLSLRKPLDLELSASPNTSDDGNAHVLASKDQPVVVNVGIEAGLPSSLFPLEIKLEATNRSITPDNSKSSIQDLPVRYGTGSDGRPAYWFEKTISWTEYNNAGISNGIKTFPVYFVTTVADNATEIHASNPNFNQATTEVENYTPATFSNLTFSGATHEVAKQETFSFRMSEVPSSGKVTVVLKGLEPAANTGLVYKQANPEGGEIYELAVSSTTASFGVIPYIPGKDATVELSSYLFTDNSASIRVEGSSGAPVVYVNPDGSGQGTRLGTVTSTKVYGDNLIPGQTATLTFYVLEEEVPENATVSIGQNGSTSATPINGASASASVTIDGVTYIGYQVTNYTVPSQGDNSAGFTLTLPVYIKVGSAAAQMKGSFSIPVYGIQLGDKLTSASQSVYNQNNGTGWYIISNDSFPTYHLYNKGSNISGRLTSTNPYTYQSLFGFNATGGSVKVAVPSASSGTSMSYVNGNGNNTTLTFNDAGSNYSFDGTKLSWQYRPMFSLTSNTNFWSQNANNSNVSGSTSDNNGIFSVYPVTFVQPE